MTAIDWLKTLWPVAVVLAAFGVRMEVGSALTKQRLRDLERQVKAERQDRKDTLAALQTRQSQFEAKIDESLKEIRRDIKTLLSRS